MVLLHGAWHGGWIWREVARGLRAQGHEVWTPTLTGMCERFHLGGPHVSMDTWTQDIMGVIQYEDLHDVVLLGHSMGGSVICNVAERMPERLAKLVYLDAVVLLDGESSRDLQAKVMGPEAVAEADERVRTQGDGWLNPYQGKNPRASSQPYLPSYGVYRAGNPAAAALPKWYIECTAKGEAGYATLRESARRAREQGMHMLTIASDHDPWRSAPTELTRMLLEIAAA